MGLVAWWHVEAFRTGDRTHVPCVGRWTVNHWEVEIVKNILSARGVKSLGSRSVHRGRLVGPPAHLAGRGTLGWGSLQTECFWLPVHRLGSGASTSQGGRSRGSAWPVPSTLTVNSTCWTTHSRPWTPMWGSISLRSALRRCSGGRPSSW